MHKSKYRRRERFVDYMLWVKGLPCAAELLSPRTPCFGAVEADHAGQRGFGQKAHDSTVIPLCSQHHRERGDFSGTFKSWNQAKMREWLAGRIVSTQRSAMARGIALPTTEQAS